MIRCILIFAILWIQAEVTAQGVYNGNLLPVGDKEALLANTGTGGINSPGAVYYNPAAMTMLSGTEISLTGTAYSQFDIKASPIAVIGETEINYEAEGFITVPTSVIIARQKKNWHLGFSIMVPYEFDYEGPVTWDVRVGGQPYSLKLLQNYSEKIVLTGLSAARKIGENWSFGVSAYLQNYSILSSTSLFINDLQNPNFVSQSVERESFSVSTMLLMLGVHRSFGKWNLGFKIDLPSAKILSGGEYYNLFYSSNSGGTIIDNDSINPNFNTPFTMRAGISYNPDEKLNLAMDFSYAGDNTYRVFEDRNIPFNYEYSSRNNFRLSSGASYRFIDQLAFSLGYAYTFSKVDNQDRDFNSVFTAMKWYTSQVQSSFGLFYCQEQGIQELNGLKSNEETTIIGLYLGTSYHF